jgi:hypothetical protein
LVLVGIGLLFEMQQAAREDQRAKAERELAEERAQDEALQAYLDQMSQLMLERKLLEAEPGDPVHTLAQARTSTVILTLDAEHNESVAHFLTNSGLAVRSTGSARPRLLNEIALSHATLSDANLFNAALSSADLSNANLSNALLSSADLSFAYLRHADLPYADLRGADLSDADLRYAEGITNEELEQQAASLKGATMPNGQKYEDWLKDREGRKQNE